jgi:hypothetical protein
MIAVESDENQECLIDTIDYIYNNSVDIIMYIYRNDENITNSITIDYISNKDDVL